MRGRVESGQYTSSDYAQVLDDHRVLASIGTVGDALDNALAESFVDSYKTELIADRVWRTRQQLELATVEWVAWFNHQRLHEALGDIPPVEYEQLHGPEVTPESPISVNGSLTSTRPRAAAGLRTRRGQALGVDFAVDRQIRSANAPVLRALPAQAAPPAGRR